MKYYFCTLFDTNFIHRGLAMYNSCIKHCENDFSIWMLCLDEDSKKIMDKLALPHAVAITVSDLNDTKLEAVRKTRTKSEFAWTCKHSLIAYVMENIQDGEIVNFLDADLFLFHPPKEIYNELEQKSILITPHGFSENEKWREDNVGAYNAGMIYMRNDDTSKKCLMRWREQCLNRCSASCDGTGCGDQQYLNEWPVLYQKTMISKNVGLNLGTWNIRKHNVTDKDGVIYVDDQPLVWYHFHGFLSYVNSKGQIKGFPASMILHDKIYQPYVNALNDAVLQIKKYVPDFRASTKPYPGLFLLIKQHLVKFIK